MNKIFYFNDISVGDKISIQTQDGIIHYVVKDIVEVATNKEEFDVNRKKKGQFQGRIKNSNFANLLFSDEHEIILMTDKPSQSPLSAPTKLIFMMDRAKE